MKLIKAVIGSIYFSGGNESEHYPKWREKVLAMATKLEPFGVELDTKKLDAGEYYGVLSCEEVILAPEQYTDLMVSGIELTGVKYVSNPMLKPGESFAAVIDKMDEILNMPSKEGTFNSKCEVHMPGQALSMYNDTQLMENSCTDELQEQLSKGWRIIAACPQPDQRRPDYILGRYNPGEV